MTVVLRDIRTAVQNYLDTHVAVSISPITPKTGTVVNKSELFTFTVSVTNSSAADAIRLVKVRYHLHVQTPAVAKLVVPATNPDAQGITYKNLPGGDFASNLAPNAEVADMYLFPSPSNFLGEGSGDLDVGDKDTIEVTGRGLVVGGTDIKFRVLAEADLDFLFPHFEDSATVVQKVDVKE